MTLWIVVLAVALGISIFLNIQLWEIARELKLELHENGRTTAYDVNTTE